MLSADFIDWFYVNVIAYCVLCLPAFMTVLYKFIGRLSYAFTAIFVFQLLLNLWLVYSYSSIVVAPAAIVFFFVYWARLKVHKFMSLITSVCVLSYFSIQVLPKLAPDSVCGLVAICHLTSIAALIILYVVALFTPVRFKWVPFVGSKKVVYQRTAVVFLICAFAMCLNIIDYDIRESAELTEITPIACAPVLFAIWGHALAFMVEDWRLRSKTNRFRRNKLMKANA